MNVRVVLCVDILWDEDNIRSSYAVRDNKIQMIKHIVTL